MPRKGKFVEFARGRVCRVQSTMGRHVARTFDKVLGILTKATVQSFILLPANISWSRFYFKKRFITSFINS